MHQFGRTLRQEQARQLHITLDRGLGQPTIANKPPPVTLHQLLDRRHGHGERGTHALVFQVLQQPIQPTRTRDIPHPGRPHRITELRDHDPVQVAGSEIAGVHPTTQITRHRQHVEHRARGIATPRQPRSVSVDERTHPARLPPPSGHDSPPSRSTLLRLQKRRSTAETMPTLRYHRIESTSRYLLFHLHPTCSSA